MSEKYIICLNGPEKGKKIMVNDKGGQSDVFEYCSVCGHKTYLSFDTEVKTNKRFCTNHWAPLPRNYHISKPAPTYNF